MTVTYNNSLRFPYGDIAVSQVDAATGRASLQVDGNGNNHGLLLDGVEDPTSHPAVAVGSAGALTGTYTYAVTYVSPAGETALYTGTPNSAAPVAQQVNLSSIPVSPSPLVTARKIYRSIANPTDVKTLKYLATISDNTTTTYTDNAADGTLGAVSPWISSCRGVMEQDNTMVAAFGNGQSVALGVGASATQTGYACTAIGYNALNLNTTGKRNVAVGTYAMPVNTTGYENTTVGTHSMNAALTTIGSAAFGYQAMFTQTSGDYNCAFGYQSLLAGTTGGGNIALGFHALGANTTGSNNTAIGYRALDSNTTTNGSVALGFLAGRYSTAASQFWVDNQDRSNLATAKTNSLMYGVFAAAPANQTLAINAAVKLLTSTVAALPSASTVGSGYKAMVSDALAPVFLSAVVGGGAVVCPVFSNGTSWIVG